MVVVVVVGAAILGGVSDALHCAVVSTCNCRYDSGDDNMKKIIGEAMMKSRSGEKMEPPSL